MTDLTFLRLDWNSLSGPVPDFARLTCLDYLNLAFNQFSGAFAPSRRFGYLAIDHNRPLVPSPNRWPGRQPPTFISATITSRAPFPVLRVQHLREDRPVSQPT
ncbi:Polygalacturonase inhibiting protein [Musa troglodytarum]|uniref:Polygalacturonase inhibiting protein n=1 Tax=Musa troglodytarum TaxID=320322 RepID=A0A9E7L231_9LILI|nr:Polygalacturonase inhibiting protein [Musa troglodytarum]